MTTDKFQKLLEMAKKSFGDLPEEEMIAKLEALLAAPRVTSNESPKPFWHVISPGGGNFLFAMEEEARLYAHLRDRIKSGEQPFSAVTPTEVTDAPLNCLTWRTPDGRISSEMGVLPPAGVQCYVDDVHAGTTPAASNQGVTVRPGQSLEGIRSWRVHGNCFASKMEALLFAQPGGILTGLPGQEPTHTLQWEGKKEGEVLPKVGTKTWAVKLVTSWSWGIYRFATKAEADFYAAFQKEVNESVKPVNESVREYTKSVPETVEYTKTRFRTQEEVDFFLKYLNPKFLKWNIACVDGEGELYELVWTEEGILWNSAEGVLPPSGEEWAKTACIGDSRSKPKPKTPSPPCWTCGSLSFKTKEEAEFYHAYDTTFPVEAGTCTGKYDTITWTCPVTGERLNASEGFLPPFPFDSQEWTLTNGEASKPETKKYVVYHFKTVEEAEFHHAHCVRYGINDSVVSTYSPSGKHFFTWVDKFGRKVDSREGVLPPPLKWDILGGGDSVPAKKDEPTKSWHVSNNAIQGYTTREEAEYAAKGFMDGPLTVHPSPLPPTLMLEWETTDGKLVNSLSGVLPPMRPDHKRYARVFIREGNSLPAEHSYWSIQATEGGCVYYTFRWKEEAERFLEEMVNHRGFTREAIHITHTSELELGGYLNTLRWKLSTGEWVSSEDGIIPESQTLEVILLIDGGVHRTVDDFKTPFRPAKKGEEGADWKEVVGVKRDEVEPEPKEESSWAGILSIVGVAVASGMLGAKKVTPKVRALTVKVESEEVEESSLPSGAKPVKVGS